MPTSLAATENCSSIASFTNENLVSLDLRTNARGSCGAQQIKTLRKKGKILDNASSETV